MTGEDDVDVAGRADRAPVSLPTPALVEEVAAALGFVVVRPLDGGSFGATLVATPDGAELVLKVSADVDLADVWATGAAMAERLRSTGYPASRYQGTGQVGDAVWSLQDVLPGTVPRRMDADLAAQLVDLVRSHRLDAGARRAWGSDARVAAEGWLVAIPRSLAAPGFHEAMASAIERTAEAELLETTIVHGDFHQFNCTTDGGEVVGVFDWEIAGPGDWRFDLVHPWFWGTVLSKAVERGAAEVLAGAVRAEVPDDVATFMLACQSLRSVAMSAWHRPDGVGRLSERILDCFEWRGSPGPVS